MYQAVQVSAAPAQEPVTVAQVRQHCRIDSSADDLYLAGLTATARSLVEQHLARALITQGLTWLLTDAPMLGAPAPGLPASLQVLPLAFTGLTLTRRPLELPRNPVQAVGAVRQVAIDGTVTTADPSTYDVLLGAEPARIRLRTGLASGGGLVVAFTAGYGDKPELVPAPIRHGVLMLAAWLYETRGDDGGEWPAVVDRLLAPYRLVTFG